LRKSLGALLVVVFATLCIGLASGFELAGFVNGTNTTAVLTTSATTTVTEIQLSRSTAQTTVLTNITIITTSTASVTTYQPVYVPCKNSTQGGLSALTIQPNSTAEICVEFFYYNPIQTTTIANPLNQFQLTGYSEVNGTTQDYNATSDFSIAASPSANITIGGPNNMNEGILVVYSLTPKPNVTGYFMLNFGWMAPSAMMCTEGTPLTVGNTFTIPNIIGGCIVRTVVCLPSVSNVNGTTATASCAVSPYPLPEGTIFAEYVMASNGTA